MKKKQKKIIFSVIAVLAALGILGIYVLADRIYFSGSEFGLKLMGMVKPGVTLHDDYDEASVKNDTIKRSVYVENSGNTKLYVRLRIYEYMELGGKSVEADAKEDDKSTWLLHTGIGTVCEECQGETHLYFHIEMGNKDPIEYKPGLKNRYESSNVFKAGDKKNQFTPKASVMTMNTYSQTGKKPHNCWVLDEDGYAYWSEKLDSKESTGAFFSGIEKLGTLDDKYKYNIYVIAETINDNELGSWTGGSLFFKTTPAKKASENAVQLLKQIEKER